MSALWLLPVAILVVGAVVVFAAGRELGRAVSDLGRSVDRWSTLRPAVLHVRADRDEIERRLAALRHRTSDR